MKKRITALTLLLAMCMTLCAHAVEPRTCMTLPVVNFLCVGY